MYAVLVDVPLCPFVDFLGGDTEVGEQDPGGGREGVVRRQRRDAGFGVTGLRGKTVLQVS